MNYCLFHSCIAEICGGPHVAHVHTLRGEQRAFSGRVGDPCSSCGRDLESSTALDWANPSKVRGQALEAYKAKAAAGRHEDAMSTAEARAVRKALHKAWLAVHVRRFSDASPDSTYHGVQLAEAAIAEVAAEYGIDWLALRAALVTEDSA